MDIYGHLVLQGLAIGVLTGILYVLVALGLTLIYGILHIVNFAHGEIYMLGAMGVFYGYVVLKLPFAVTLVAILVLSLVLGLVVERGFFRSLRGQWLQLVVASVGISLIIQSLGWIAFGIQEKNVPSFFTGVVAFAGVRLPIERLIAAAVGVVLVVAPLPPRVPDEGRPGHAGDRGGRGDRAHARASTPTASPPWPAPSGSPWPRWRGRSWRPSTR